MEKYLTIYHDLVDNISKDSWTETSMLPSENNLAMEYHVSRETIRKALNLLVQDGYIQKVRGKGSVIIKQDTFDFPVSGIVSFKELANKLNFQAKTILHERRTVKADALLKDKLEVPLDKSILKVSRIREFAGEKVILDKDYFNPDIVPTLSEAVCEDSIYAYLENTLDLKISYARKEITVEEPTKLDRDLLDLGNHSNVVVIKSQVYLEDTTLFQYTESRHRPDKFKFVDFARRVRN